MDVREKLVEQLLWWSDECDRTNFECQAIKLLVEAADYIANGVTVQEHGWIKIYAGSMYPYSCSKLDWLQQTTEEVYHAQE